MKGTSITTAAVARFPVFVDRPSEEYIHRWRRHIDETGAPEAFEHVSTDKPQSHDDVRLLSEDIKVPVSRRVGGDMVPCPICSPTGPKFKMGRMAWFPSERTTRFIGHRCAGRHFGDSYEHAQRLYAVETQCQDLIRIWPHFQKHLPWLNLVRRKLAPVARTVQDVRQSLDEQAPGFAHGLYRDRISYPGRLPFSFDPLGASGLLKGLVFLEDDFRPFNQLETIRDVHIDIARPLPTWTPAEGENNAAREIIRRGREAKAALDALPHLIHDVREARDFLTRANLSVLEKWVSGGLSPLSQLVFRWKGSLVELRAEGFQGRFRADIEVSSDINGKMPTQADAKVSMEKAN